MRAYEREFGESRQAYSAFCTYRDLGEARSIDRAYRVHTGLQESRKRASGRWNTWCKKHDWVGRVQAYEDHMEMERRNAIEQYERKRGTKQATREAEVQDRLLGVKERLVEKMEAMASWSLQKQTVTSEDGREITHTYPAKWSFHTLVRAIEVLDDSPDKIAFTDPAGNREYGQDPDSVRERFLQIIEGMDEEEDHGRAAP